MGGGGFSRLIERVVGGCGVFAQTREVLELLAVGTQAVLFVGLQAGAFDFLVLVAAEVELAQALLLIAAQRIEFFA